MFLSEPTDLASVVYGILWLDCGGANSFAQCESGRGA